MNIRWLKYFLTVADSGSITEASRRLYVSQPALTKAINSLEREYKIKLLNRTAKGIELTKEGLDFAYYAFKVVDSADILESSFRAAVEKKQTLSRVFLASQHLDFTDRLLGSIYVEREGEPIHFLSVIGDRDSIIQYVLEARVSLGIIVTNVNDGKTSPWVAHADKLEYIELDTAGVYAAVGEKSPYFDRESITLQEISANSTLMLDMGGNTWQNAVLDMEVNYYSDDRIVITNSIETCKAFLRNTDMVLYVSKWTAKLVEREDIRILPVLDAEGQDLTGSNQLRMYKKKDKLLYPTEQILVKKIKEHFGLKEKEAVFWT